MRRNLISRTGDFAKQSSGSERASAGCQRSAGRASKALRDCYLIGCVLIYWGCLVAAGVLYGLLAAAIVLVCACAAAVGTMMFFAE